MKWKTNSDCDILVAVPTLHIVNNTANSSYHHVILVSFLFNTFIEDRLVTIVQSADREMVILCVIWDQFLT